MDGLNIIILLTLPFSCFHVFTSHIKYQNPFVGNILLDLIPLDSNNIIINHHHFEFFHVYKYGIHDAAVL